MLNQSNPANAAQPAPVAVVALPLYRRHRWTYESITIASILIVLIALIWQAITAHGNPDPDTPNISKAAVVLDTGILVFREGLEAILVLAALTASLIRTDKQHLKPVALGTGLSFVATIITWFIVVALITTIDSPQRALDVQAGTGLLAIAVLLVVMNWFFHKFYWTGWITMHNRRKRDLTENPNRSATAIYRGLVLLGFTAVYREGFEIVLFLQSLRLKAGTFVVMEGAAIGLILTLLVAVIVFVLHYRLPFKKMLVLTGIMLAGVLVVMVGENIQEMQADVGSGWISTHPINIHMPDWLGTWFAIFPNWEGIGAQLGTIILVAGSYFLARHLGTRKSSCAMPPAIQCATECPTPCAEEATFAKAIGDPSLQACVQPANRNPQPKLEPRA